MLKTLKTSALIGAAVIAFSLNANAGQHFDKSQANAYEVTRLGMMITPEMLPGKDGEDINGPTVIKVPSWVKNAPGKYLMYFAHHTGQYIRMAYADKITGPWKIYDGGVLKNTQLPWKPDHIASPEIYIDEANKELWMYFHAPTVPALAFDDPDYEKYVANLPQVSYRAVSKDGVNWEVGTQEMGENYIRVWKDKFGGFWAFSYAGYLSFSRDGKAPYERLSPGPFDKMPNTFAVVRHPAHIDNKDGTLTVFYSKISDTPESILVTTVNVKGEDWTKWTASQPKLVMVPETEYEGGKLPMVTSRVGANHKPERGLRDPYPFVEDGKLYLFYSVKGEKGIALAELKEKKN